MKVGLGEMLGDRRNVMGRNRTYLFTILCHLGSMPCPLMERRQTMVQLDLLQTSPPSKDKRRCKGNWQAQAKNENRVANGKQRGGGRSRELPKKMGNLNITAPKGHLLGGPPREEVSVQFVSTL